MIIITKRLIIKYFAFTDLLFSFPSLFLFTKSFTSSVILFNFILSSCKLLKGFLIPAFIFVNNEVFALLVSSKSGCILSTLPTNVFIVSFISSNFCNSVVLLFCCLIFLIYSLYVFSYSTIN